MAYVVIIEFEHMPWDNKRCYSGTYTDPNKNNKEIVGGFCFLGLGVVERRPLHGSFM